MNSLARPSHRFSERGWEGPNCLSLAGRMPVAALLRRGADSARSGGFRQASPQAPASLRSASALSVFSHVKAVKASLFSTFFPPMNSFHL